MSGDRYSRQTVLPEIGRQGQALLGEATAVVLGCGALGGVIAELLARAGVGHLRLVDRDVVERNNLQRQLLFDEDDARRGTPKAEAAARHLGRINSEITLEPRVVDAHAGNIEQLLEGAQVLLDGTDNLETRYLANDACVKHGVPWFYGGVVGTGGLALAILPGRGPCLRCLFPEPPPAGATPTCDTAGVLNASPVLVGAVQSAAAIRQLVSPGDLEPGLLSVDLWQGTYRVARVHRDPACPCCWEGSYDFLSRRRGSWTTTLCGRNAVQITPSSAPGFDLDALAERLRGHGEVTSSGSMLRLELPEHTVLVFADGRAIIQGTEDEARARTLYARYLGA